MYTISGTRQHPFLHPTATRITRCCPDCGANRATNTAGTDSTQAPTCQPLQYEHRRTGALSANWALSTATYLLADKQRDLACQAYRPRLHGDRPVYSVQRTGELFDARKSKSTSNPPLKPVRGSAGRALAAMAGLPGPRPVEGAEPRPKWNAYVCHAVPADLLTITSDIGMDRNMGRCTKSHDTVKKSQHEPHGCPRTVAEQAGTVAEREGTAGNTGPATYCTGSRRAHGTRLRTRHPGAGPTGRGTGCSRPWAPRT